MHDEPEIFQFPELCDELVVVLNNFLEELLTQFQNHYFAQMHRYYADLPKPDRYAAQSHCSSTIRGSDSLGNDCGVPAAVTLADGPSSIVKISPSNQLTALT